MQANVPSSSVVRHTVGPMDPGRLRLVRKGEGFYKLPSAGGKNHVAKGRGVQTHARGRDGSIMVASRAALHAEEEQFTLGNVMRQLLRPYRECTLSCMISRRDGKGNDFLFHAVSPSTEQVGTDAWVEQKKASVIATPIMPS